MGCCQCFTNILSKFDVPCCNRYFPEWKVGASWWIFGFRTLIIFVFSALMLIFCFLWSEQMFETSRITFGSGFILSLFMTNSVFLILLYGPYLIKTYRWWVSVVVFVVYIASSLFLMIQQLILGKYLQFNDDNELFGIWTIIHFLAGPFFALVLPFTWMMLIVIGWEIMEKLTFGFGESESLGNRAIDIGVAIVGWWLLILIFKHTRKDIPWISAMNAAGNNGEEIDWKKVVNKVTCGKCFNQKDEEKVCDQMVNENKDANIEVATVDKSTLSFHL